MFLDRYMDGEWVDRWMDLEDGQMAELEDRWNGCVDRKIDRQKPGYHVEGLWIEQLSTFQASSTISSPNMAILLELDFWII